MKNAPLLAVMGCAASVVCLVVACGNSSSEFGSSSGSSGVDGQLAPDGSFGPTTPDGGDPYANDPPPQWCGPSGQPAPPKPGGTQECPDDKNKPGCGCDTLGQTAPCWTGLRVNRALGVCKDGVTTCQLISETTKGWGPCVGEVLPTSGATKGAAACKCFSQGQWKIANLSPCFETWNAGPNYAISSLPPTGDGGPVTCPPLTHDAPFDVPSQNWSTDTLKVDCAGHFTLCYELKAGDAKNPQPSDCSLTKVCVTADYLTENVEQDFPPLGAWSSNDSACAAKWIASGGYGEMTVKGLSVRCDTVDDGAGNPYVFNRVQYCPTICQDSAHASDPACQNCQQGGSGTF